MGSTQREHWIKGLPLRTEARHANRSGDTNEARPAGVSQREEAPGAVVHFCTGHDGRRRRQRGSAEGLPAFRTPKVAALIGAVVLVHVAAGETGGPKCRVGPWRRSSGGCRGGGRGGRKLAVGGGDVKLEVKKSLL